MKFLCNSPVISLRREPSERSELVSQLLFGEAYQVIDLNAGWLLVQSLYDGYEGWLSLAQHSNVTTDGQDFHENYIVQSKILEAITLNGRSILLPFGSNLTKIGGLFAQEQLQQWHESGKIVSQSDNNASKVLEYALMLLGSPYLWGGRNPLGYDCSGFVQVVFKVAGIKLPRDARDQATFGQMLDFVYEASAGDLAFFENDSRQIVHVGIVDGKGGIIHCSGQVRYDILDAYGILNRYEKKHTHKLRFIRKIC